MNNYLNFEFTPLFPTASPPTVSPVKTTACAMCGLKFHDSDDIARLRRVGMHMRVAHPVSKNK